MTNKISCGIKNIPEIESYFTALTVAGKSNCTIRNYRKDIDKMIEYFSIEKVKDIQSLGIADYRKFIGDLKLAPSSINATIRNLGAGLNWLEENEFISGCKFKSIKFGKGKFVKQAKIHRDVLSDEEIGKMINSTKNRQLRFMIGIMCWIGLRSDEVRSILVTDVKNNEIWIKGKGQKERQVVLNPILSKLYDEFMEVRDSKSEYLFYSNHSDYKLTSKTIIDRINSLYKSAELSGKHITAHSLRRSAATNIIKEYGIVVAQRTLGHSDIKTTQVYNFVDAEYIKETMKNTTRTFGL